MALRYRDAERAREAGTFGHRRRRAEDHVEAGRDDATVHRPGRPFVDVRVGDERDGVVALADHLERWRERVRVPEEGVALPHLRLGVDPTAQAPGRLVATAGFVVGEGGGDGVERGGRCVEGLGVGVGRDEPGHHARAASAARRLAATRSGSASGS